MKYVLRIDHVVREPQWEVCVEMPSDALAMYYANKIAASSMAFRSTGGQLNLFNVEKNTLVASYVLKEPEVLNVHNG